MDKVCAASGPPLCTCESVFGGLGRIICATIVFGTVGDVVVGVLLKVSTRFHQLG